MSDARETVLAAGPPDFNISLSTCYNYTQNYRKGTYQAKQHHEGKDVNAMISLHSAPKTAVVKETVVNAHYCSANINYLADIAAENTDDTCIDSKDAKAAVRYNNSLGGKTWVVCEAPDHDWDQSRTNAITPMGHLFLETKIMKTLPDNLSLELECTTEKVLHVTRTGKAVYLLNLSFYEPETVYRCFNELFVLLAEPALDEYFRNPISGKLKSSFVFVVDNGPSECPSSPLVRMLLARFQQFLNLDRVIQISNAEYYSKRNFVEIVHASVNLHIQRLGIIKSSSIFKEPEAGSQEHIKNMDAVAEELQHVIQNASFGGHKIQCFRGVGADHTFLFDDENILRKFLSLSEQRKMESNLGYGVKQNKLSEILHMTWGSGENFKAKYADDYARLNNEFGDMTTAFSGKYVTAIFRPDDNWIGNNSSRAIIQPLPDYIRYIRTGRLHYMSYEMRKSLECGFWDNHPDIFLPETILGLAFKVIPHLTADISNSLAFLSWITKTEVENYFHHLRKQMEKDLTNEIERNRWQNHELFKKTKAELVKMSADQNVPSTGTKVDLVKKLAEKLEIEVPERSIFDGDLSTIPDSIQGIHRLNIAKIKEVLSFFQVPTIGTKDELSLRLLALRLGSRNLIFQKEANLILDLINISKQLIFAQKSLYICQEEFIHRERAFGVRGNPSLSSHRPRRNAGNCGEKRNLSEVELPFGISEENLQDIFETIERYIENITCQKSKEQVSTQRDVICLPGKRILIYWGDEELGASNRKAGWFPAKIMKYEEYKDEITVKYISEKDKEYKINVDDAMKRKIIKSARTTLSESSIYDKVIEVGSSILLKWTNQEAEIANMNPGKFLLHFIKYNHTFTFNILITSCFKCSTDFLQDNCRWYAAEVQDYSPEEDTITVLLRKNSSIHTLDVTEKIVRGNIKLSKAVI
ncbi:SGSM3 [Mytilus coruscus]|uniref:SGSM3 n=1 Tax=Mytilus coruscus TaxID=42192 RepID=A0A6J8ESK7_MYTCO|nr:SGSM3 [Mytilus coruscus]